MLKNFIILLPLLTIIPDSSGLKTTIVPKESKEIKISGIPSFSIDEESSEYIISIPIDPVLEYQPSVSIFKVTKDKAAVSKTMQKETKRKLVKKNFEKKEQAASNFGLENVPEFQASDSCKVEFETENAPISEETDLLEVEASKESSNMETIKESESEMIDETMETEQTEDIQVPFVSSSQLILADVVKVDFSDISSDVAQSVLNNHEKIPCFTHEIEEISASDFWLICRIVNNESAAESKECQVAVCETILNRLQYGGYGENIEEIVTSPFQYSTAENGEISWEVIQSCMYALSIQSYPDTLVYFRMDYFHDFGTPYMVVDNTFFSLN